MSEEIKKFERLPNGLVKGVEYKYNEDGKINWRAMIKSEHLVFNKQYEKEIVEKYKKPLSELNPNEVEDKYILILLSGIKYISKLRGYISVSRPAILVANNFISATHEITWIPNEETGNIVETFGDGADATPDNTNGFGKNFLTTIAINRSFVRTVRNYLEINIVGFDEMSKNFTEKEVQTTPNGVTNPSGMLRNTASDLNLTFDVIKKGASTKYKDKIESKCEEWKDFDSIPPRDCLTLIGLLKK